MQGHSRIGQKRVMILKEVKRSHISGNIQEWLGAFEKEGIFSHCDFGVKFSGNRSLHDYNFASSGHITLK
jgi:hypothetical protein